MTGELSDYLRLLVQYRVGAAVAMMVYLGDALGLYQALQGIGWTTAEGLAQRTGLHPRWILEWLLAQAAAGLVETDGKEFRLPDTYATALADHTSPAYLAGLFESVPVHALLVRSLPAAFTTGRGIDLDVVESELVRARERVREPWIRHILVPDVISSLRDVDAALRFGVAAVEIGCGSGLALVELARRYPASTFHGYDPSEHALARAAEHCAQAGVTNVDLHALPAQHLPADLRFRVAFAFDCMHEMAEPQRVMAALHGAVARDGMLLVEDFRPPEGAHDRDRIALAYANSVLTCLSAGLTTESPGAGLGTLGFTPQLAERLARKAGFVSFTVHDFGHPQYLHYEIRP